jgi:hypothetical protein
VFPGCHSTPRCYCNSFHGCRLKALLVNQGQDHNICINLPAEHVNRALDSQKGTCLKRTKPFTKRGTSSGTDPTPKSNTVGSNRAFYHDPWLVFWIAESAVLRVYVRLKREEKRRSGELETRIHGATLGPGHVTLTSQHIQSRTNSFPGHKGSHEGKRGL